MEARLCDVGHKLTNVRSFLNELRNIAVNSALVSSTTMARLKRGNVLLGIQRKPRQATSKEAELDDEDDSYEPYVPVAQRRQAKLAKLTSWGANAEKDKARRLQEEQDERDDEEREEELLGPPVEGPASISKLKKSSRAVAMAKLDERGLSTIVSTTLHDEEVAVAG